MAISLRLSEEDTKLIKDYAKINNMSVSDLIRQAVLQIEKKVDVIKAYFEIDNQRSKREVAEVKDILRNREELKTN